MVLICLFHAICIYMNKNRSYTNIKSHKSVPGKGNAKLKCHEQKIVYSIWHLRNEQVGFCYMLQAGNYPNWEFIWHNWPFGCDLEKHDFSSKIHFILISMKEWVSFFLGSWRMNRSAGQTNRVSREAVLGRFVCSALRFIPHEPRKKTLIPYIYNATNKDPF